MQASTQDERNRCRTRAGGSRVKGGGRGVILRVTWSPTWRVTRAPLGRRWVQQSWSHRHSKSKNTAKYRLRHAWLASAPPRFGGALALPGSAPTSAACDRAPPADRVDSVGSVLAGSTGRVQYRRGTEDRDGHTKRKVNFMFHSFKQS